MFRNFLYLIAATAAAVANGVQADTVLEWNSVARSVMQSEGLRPVNNSNPGWATRSLAMLNGAVYDIYQASNRTHSPFLVDTLAAPDTSRDAAAHQAASEILLHCYPTEAATITSLYDSKMTSIATGMAKTNGIALGSQVAQAYIADRSADHASDSFPYTAGTAAGDWWPQPGQVAWGPGWGTVTPFAIGSSQPFIDALPPLPSLDSQAYTDAFNQVKNYGGVVSSQRTAEQTEIGLFWAYDRANMGPPPVLFLRNLAEIAVQTGNTTEENARLFAMASVAMADAAISAWDAKFDDNFWRPIAGVTGQRSDWTTGHDDGNPNTIEDPNWLPLGAPGIDPSSTSDDFTPPFPAYVSGHATMGAAMFNTVKLFYGTNSFDAIDGQIGNDASFSLSSEEYTEGGIVGMAREYTTFTENGLLDLLNPQSPDGENTASRIFLGVHWSFDQIDGNQLGASIANYVFANEFQAVPEPATILFAGMAMLFGCLRRRAG